MMAQGTGNLTRFEKTRIISRLAVASILLAGWSVPALAEQMTLEQALETAFAQSPTMQNAALSLEISERNLKAQNAALKSQFNLTITPYQYSRDNVFNELLSQYNTQEQTSAGGRLSITQPIKWTDGTLSVIQAFDWREAASSYTGSVKEATYNNSL
ncbi:MAG: TolC family protein, partial [Gammaproteobacteria bacterium]|nr:TolC family protein [Gammaproteobacteria bacterium]